MIGAQKAQSPTARKMISALAFLLELEASAEIKHQQC